MTVVEFGGAGMKTHSMAIPVIIILTMLGVERTRGQIANPELSLIEFNQVSNTVHFEWSSTSNAVYELESCANLTNGVWFKEGSVGSVLGQPPTNSASVLAGSDSSRFFRLMTHANSPQHTTQNAFLFRSDTNTTLNETLWHGPGSNPAGSYIHIWDDVNSNYYTSYNLNRCGFCWSPDLNLSSNQMFIYDPPPEVSPPIPDFWPPFANIRNWRLTFPDNVPVTGDVRIEWVPLESHSTPANPLPDLYSAKVGVKNSEEESVALWSALSPETSFVIWDGQNNPAGYYTITLEIGCPGDLELETIEKQVYLYH